MKTKYLNLIVLSAAVLFAGCQTTKPDNKPKYLQDRNVNYEERLVNWMQGSFSSRAQSEKNEAYFDIHLNMVRIWSQRDDGYWLYVEQAAAGYLDKPYRQRIYHVSSFELDESADQLAPFIQYASVVYEMEDAMAFAGAYANPEAFNVIKPENLVKRVGCTVILKLQKDGSFAGSTHRKNCLSSLRGATYATSVVRINKNSIESWDQGFNDADEQVWGATEGPYIFVRQ